MKLTPKENQLLVEALHVAAAIEENSKKAAAMEKLRAKLLTTQKASKTTKGG